MGPQHIHNTSTNPDPHRDRSIGGIVLVSIVYRTCIDRISYLYRSYHNILRTTRTSILQSAMLCYGMVWYGICYAMICNAMVYAMGMLCDADKIDRSHRASQLVINDRILHTSIATYFMLCIYYIILLELNQ